ncbi:MAG: sugar ABC transporter ATP-binding protein [Clostridiales bacterium]|jgi:ribose transport system ATP-binding protein|nr:sugar ABC transporter ATP-binding protein [Clostridiales bacterium]
MQERKDSRDGAAVSGRRASGKEEKSGYIVELSHINKSFPGVKALDDVSFSLKSGEVLALLGENGAGKSTLMKVLSGIYSRDGGDITIFGEKQGEFNTKKAKEMGVAIIHQELNMCSHLSVAENIFLGREIRKNGVLSQAEMNRRSAEVLGSLNIDMAPEMIVGDLAVSKQQMVEIAKALSINAKILIMDEPTSALTAKEIDDLFRIIKECRANGCGIVYISHRLEEIAHIADRVAIMRDGKFITSMNYADTSLSEIISFMVGREIKEKFPKVTCKKGKKIFEISGLNAGKMVRDVSFELYEGEIVGVAGLMGAGRTETMRAIFGVDQKQSGKIVLDGKPITIRRPYDAISQGVVLAPEDRKKDGLCTRLTVRENIALPSLDTLSGPLGYVNVKKEKEIVDKSVRDLHIKLPHAEVDAASLSGGNQQKVVVSKWLARNSRVVIFDEPTRGIDVAAKVEIYHLMNDLKKRGIGIIFVSSEMPEILGFSDRIIVMCDGRITGELMADKATQNQILEYATMFEDKFAQPEAS